MVVEPGSRQRLIKRLEKAIGMEESRTLLDLLPPFGWHEMATKSDMRDLRQELKQEIRDLKSDLKEDIARQLVEFEGRLAATLRAEWRGDLIAALHSQSRTMFFQMIGLILSIAVLVLAAGRLF